MSPRGRALAVCSAFLVLFAGVSIADSGANHQVRNLHFGVSGGNINDVSRAFCCSGTLGSLVTDGLNSYVLSNNHVLARSGTAVAGEDISQPGLVDNGCRVPPIVADFTVAAPLGSNVDAALAALRPGQMDPTGFIEDIGTPSSIVATPSVGLPVAKSGRTTGFTTGTIASVNTSVNVRYQQGCGKGKKFLVSYVNQVVINSSTFSAGGDSGSLIVTNDACHQPVALLYAGSSSSTIGNPIGEVLSKLSAALGSSVSFVGVTCATAPLVMSTAGATGGIEHALQVLPTVQFDFMSRPGVIGVGAGASDTDPSAGAIHVYVDRTSGHRPDLPLQVEGIKVLQIFTDPFVAY